VKISREFGLGESNSQDEVFLKGEVLIEVYQPGFSLKIDAV